MVHSLGDGWEVYYGVILWSDCMQAITFLAMMCAGFSAFRRWMQQPYGKHLDVKESVGVIVPCYLPNEEPIIKDTVEHLLNNLEHVQNLTVYLVYNTPMDMPIEGDLHGMAQQYSHAEDSPRLVVRRVAKSTSKAENLNDVIKDTTEEYVAIYDADHHPEKLSLALSIWHLKNSGADCMQGSTYIREGNIFFRMLICAEFFVNYFVILPAMQVVSGTGFFGGANGVWLGSSLRQLHFDPKALTEDIDCFAHAVVEKNFKFRFLPESASGELLPNGLTAFWKQRLRWAMGWDEVTLRHASAFWKAPGLSARRRFGLCYIFFCRWLTQLCAVCIVLFNVTAALQLELATEAEDFEKLKAPKSVKNLQFLSFCFYCVFMMVAYIMGMIHCDVKLLLGLFMYFLVMPLYVIFNTVLLTISLFRVTSGRTGGWVVTSRYTGAKKPDAQLPLLTHDDLMSTTSTSSGGKIDSCGSRIILFFFGCMGTTVGGLVGYFWGMHLEYRPLWGWVPFGLGATPVWVVDDNMVIAGIVIGCFSGILCYFLAAHCCRQCSSSEE
mmetsp:Transcript_24321/g.52912  ORF Transcript_24321/g.52912 Transcript_24321/m.52912 type:complete len:551 (+) Transcript_24321:307-1959(+)